MRCVPARHLGTVEPVFHGHFKLCCHERWPLEIKATVMTLVGHFTKWVVTAVNKRLYV